MSRDWSKVNAWSYALGSSHRGQRNAVTGYRSRRVFLRWLLSQALAEEERPEPYTGQQTRAIKALSDEDVASLRKGEGMGMAKAAELNGFPGPAHVIALSRELNLTTAQLHQASLVFERMSGAAKSLGSEIVSREEALDQLFASKAVTVEQLKAETTTIGELHGRLRAVHLTPHVEIRALITPEQLVRYQELRGYSDRLMPMTQHDAQ